MSYLRDVNLWPTNKILLTDGLACWIRAQMFTGPQPTGVKLMLFSIVNIFDYCYYYYYHHLGLRFMEEQSTKLYVLSTLNFLGTISKFHTFVTIFL
jgi:hypothetical protein